MAKTFSIDPRLCLTCEQMRTQGDFISDSGAPMAQCCYCASKVPVTAFDEKHLGIMNRIGRMKKLATKMRHDYAFASTGNGIDQDDARALAELVEIFFRDDLKKLTEDK